MKKEIKQRNYSLYIGIIIGLVIGIAGLYFISKYLYMNDAYWHIKTGEWVSQKGIIDKCYGSWVLEEDSWIAHEWLFGWILYQISKSGMNNIVRFFDFLFLIVEFLCLYQGGILKKNERPTMFYWEVVLVLQFSIYALQMTARPQYITTIFIALFILILNNSKKNNYKSLYFLPLITIVWTNIHGGTAVLSYLILFIYFICNIFDGNIGKIYFQKASIKWIIHCCIVLFLTIISIMINPYGYQMLLYPYQNMQDKLMLSLIAEWASPDAKNITTLIFQIIPVLLGLVALIQCPQKIKAYDVALFFFFIILYLRSKRFYPFLIITQTCLITPYAFSFRELFKFNKKEMTLWQRNINNLCIVLLGIFCLGYIIISCATANFDKIEKNKEIPDQLLNQIIQDQPQKLCNSYGIGGYLLFHNIDVFVDGRYEPYNQKGVINDYVTLMHTKDINDYYKIDGIIQKYNFDSFLISPENFSLVIYLENRPNKYELCYKDEKWLYYKIKVVDIEDKIIKMKYTSNNKYY